MKTLRFIFPTIILLAGLTSPSSAQFSKNTTAGANIVQGLRISENAPMHFGTMSIPSAPVNVVLTTSNSRTSSSPSNINLLSQFPVSENATYTVAGSGAATYAITLPLNGAVTISNGTDHMEIVNFVAHTVSTGLDGNTGLLDASGTDSFTVGATLKLESGQPFGIYTGTFGISVNYN